MAQVMEAQPELLDEASGYLLAITGLGSVKYTYSGVRQQEADGILSNLGD